MVHLRETNRTPQATLMFWWSASRKVTLWRKQYRNSNGDSDEKSITRSSAGRNWSHDVPAKIPSSKTSGTIGASRLSVPHEETQAYASPKFCPPVISTAYDVAIHSRCAIPPLAFSYCGEGAPSFSPRTH